MSNHTNNHPPSSGSIWNDWAYRKIEANRTKRDCLCYDIDPVTGERRVSEIHAKRKQADNIQAVKDYCYLHNIEKDALLTMLKSLTNGGI